MPSMYIYDSNPGEGAVSETASTPDLAGLVAVVEDSNSPDQELADGAPLGLRDHRTGSSGLIAGQCVYSYGRQWFQMFIVISSSALSKERAEQILNELFPGWDLNEDEETEDEETDD